MTTRLTALAVLTAIALASAASSSVAAQTYGSASAVAATLGATASPPLAGSVSRAPAPPVTLEDPQATGSTAPREHMHLRTHRRR